VPRAVVVDTLPRTATGKLQRFRVRELARSVDALRRPRIADHPQDEADTQIGISTAGR
jgi:hypothetical protein